MERFVVDVKKLVDTTEKALVNLAEIAKLMREDLIRRNKRRRKKRRLMELLYDSDSSTNSDTTESSR